MVGLIEKLKQVAMLLQQAGSVVVRVAGNTVFVERFEDQDASIFLKAGNFVQRFEVMLKVGEP